MWGGGSVSINWEKGKERESEKLQNGVPQSAPHPLRKAGTPGEVGSRQTSRVKESGEFSEREHEGRASCDHTVRSLETSFQEDPEPPLPQLCPGAQVLGVHPVQEPGPLVIPTLSFRSHRNLSLWARLCMKTPSRWPVSTERISMAFSPQPMIWLEQI